MICVQVGIGSNGWPHVHLLHVFRLCVCLSDIIKHGVPVGPSFDLFVQSSEDLNAEQMTLSPCSFTCHCAAKYMCVSDDRSDFSVKFSEVMSQLIPTAVSCSLDVSFELWSFFFSSKERQKKIEKVRRKPSPRQKS